MSNLDISFCPYKGLEPYTEADQNYFFGRERDQEIIVSNLYAAPLTILYGAAGVGKSSVLLAGVLPQLRGTTRLAVVVFRDWQHPDFASTLKKEVLSAVSQSAGKELSVDLEQPLDDLLAECSHALRGIIFIILDQFEEFFLYHAASKEDGFDAEFARAVNREEIDANFLVSMREDSLSKLDRFQHRINNLLSNRLRLEYLAKDAAKAAIRKPLWLYNSRRPKGKKIWMEGRLVNELLEKTQYNKIISDQAGQGQVAAQNQGEDKIGRIETSLLQMVLTRLWDAEMAVASPRLRLSTLKRLGGIENIARTHLDDALKQLTQTDRDIASNVLRFLVTPDLAKIAQGCSALAYLAEIAEEKVQPVLASLSSQEVRILRKVRAPGRTDRYEIFHDVLAPAILEWCGQYAAKKKLAEAERHTAEQKRQLEQAQALAEAQRQYAGEQERRAQAEYLRAEEQQRRAEAERLRAEEQQRRVEAERLRTEEQERRAEAERLRAEEQQRRAEAESKAARLRGLLAVAMTLMFLLAMIFAVSFLRQKNEAVRQRALAEEATRKVGKTNIEAFEADILNTGTREKLYQNSDLQMLLNDLKDALRDYSRDGNAKGEAIILNNIGGLYHSSGLKFNMQEQYTEAQQSYQFAEQHFKRALEKMDKALDPNNYYVAKTCNDLAVVYYEQAKFAEAEPLFKRAREIIENALGSDNAYVADILNNLAEFYNTQGKYSKAQTLYERALKIREETLPPDSPDVAASLNNLADLYREQGKYDLAKPLYERAKRIRENAPGPKDEDVDLGITLTGLAELYREQGKYTDNEQFFKDAEALFEQALDIDMKVQGPKSHEVAWDRNNLAQLYSDWGKYAKAEPLFKEAVAKWEKSWGLEYLDGSIALSNLGYLYYKRNNLSEAERRLKQAREIQEKSLPDSPFLAQTLSHLAELYGAQQNYDVAESLFKQALDIQEKTLGPDHPDATYARNKYNDLLKR